jgi:tetratricopeptide (TPR) repeat protein
MSRKIHSVGFLVFTALCGLLLISGRPLPAQEQPLDTTELRRLADESYVEGYLDRAALLYLELAARETTIQGRAQALVTAAWLQQLQGKDQEAVETLTRALALEPDFSFDPALYNREFELQFERARRLAVNERDREAAQRVQEALVELEEGQTEGARRQLDAAIELSPDRPVALYNLAVLDYQEGDRVTAMERFERVVSLTYRDDDPGSRSLRAKALTSIGVIFAEQERWADAERPFAEAAGLDPGNVAIWRNLGIARARQHLSISAAEAFRRALEIEPDNSELTRYLAQAVSESGDLPGAAEVLAAGINQTPGDPGLWLELGLVQRRSSQPDQAIRSLEQAIILDPQNRQELAAKAAPHLALALYQVGEHERAIEVARQSIAWRPDAAGDWNTLGLAQRGLERNHEAVTSFARAAEIDPERAQYRFNLGAAYVALGDLTRAEGAYVHGLNLEPGSSSAQQSLEQIRERLAAERAIVTGAAPTPHVVAKKPLPPKKIGLRFVELDYKQLGLRGALVKEVVKKSPAALAGMRKGDLVLWIGDYSVLSSKDFMEYLRRNPPGELLELRYLRDGETFSATLDLR